MPLITFDPARQILAIDPAQTTGYFHSAGHRGIWQIGSGNERLLRLRDFIMDCARAWGCKLIGAEYASFGSPHVRGQAMANELLGIIRQCAAELRVDVVTYGPSSIKKFACGNGRAEKAQLVAACETWFGFRPETHDVADAAFICAMAEQGYQTNTARRPRKRKPNPLAPGAKAPRRKPWMLF